MWLIQWDDNDKLFKQNCYTKNARDRFDKNEQNACHNNYTFRQLQWHQLEPIFLVESTAMNLHHIGKKRPTEIFRTFFSSNLAKNLHPYRSKPLGKKAIKLTLIWILKVRMLIWKIYAQMGQECPEYRGMADGNCTFPFYKMIKLVFHLYILYFNL